MFIKKQYDWSGDIDINNVGSLDFYLQSQKKKQKDNIYIKADVRLD